MKKYILIQNYPGSPPVNTVVERKDQNLFVAQISGRVFTSREIMDYPTFWKLLSNYRILTLQFNDRPYDIIDFKENSNHHEGYNIHSIERLSDKAVFKLGDRILFSGKKDPYTIYRFKEIKYSVEDSSWAEGIHAILQDDIPLNSNNILHGLIDETVKKALKKSKDSWPLTEGDDCFYVNLHFNIISNKYYSGGLWKMEELFKFKHNAEEFVLQNKPVLSLKDVESVFVTANRKKQDGTYMKQAEKIRNLIKSKIVKNV